MSTTSVYEATETQKLPRVGEIELEHWRGIVGGYPQSKWVADKMAQIARTERGLATTVYRPAYVVGDTAHGLWNTDDFLCRLIKGCIQLGAAPELEADIGADMTPVDHVARSVVNLIFKPGARGRTFNIVNPVGRLPFCRLFVAIATFGYPVRRHQVDDHFALPHSSPGWIPPYLDPKGALCRMAAAVAGCYQLRRGERAQRTDGAFRGGLGGVAARARIRASQRRQPLG